MTVAELPDATLRDIWQPSPVRYNHIPNWFRLALLKAYGCRNGDTNGWYVLMDAGEANKWNWLDHFGSTKYRSLRDEVRNLRPTEAFVSEPYGFSAIDLHQIRDLCKQAKVEYHLSPNSWHAPGSTLRVLIVPDRLTMPSKGFEIVSLAEMAKLPTLPKPPEPRKLPAWSWLLERAPALRSIEYLAWDYHKNWPDKMIGWSDVKVLLSQCVGWGSPIYELRTCSAYDVAYDRLYARWDTGKVPRKRNRL